MAKWANDLVMDAALGAVDDATIECVCSAQPTTFTEANTTYKLASSALTAGAGNGDFTLADGDTNGRKLTVSQKTNVSITNSGTATHVALVNGNTNTLLYVTICTSQALTAGGTVTVPVWSITISDPS